MSKINLTFKGKTYSIDRALLSDVFSNLDSAFTELENAVPEINYSVGLAFTSNGDGTCSVSGRGECTDAYIVIPPSSPDGDSVVAIGDSAFESDEIILSVIIPDSVSTIGMFAFQACDILKSANCGNSVTYITDKAFRSCSSLEDITLGSNLTAIGYDAFADCLSLNDIVYKGTVEQWKNVVLREYWNDNIPATHIQCADGKVDMNGNIIPEDDETPDIIYSEGLEFESNGDGTCTCIGRGSCPDQHLVIPPVSPSGDTVIIIGENAFREDPEILSITIPESITYIGDRALYDSINIASITYLGTVDQWNSIEKYEWFGDMPATYIQCSDGKADLWI